MTISIDTLDVRSSWQRALDRPARIALKLDRVRLARRDPVMGKRVPWEHRHWHLTRGQSAAIRAGARAAYYRFGPMYLPQDWQHEGGGYGPNAATNVQIRALHFMNDHLSEVANSWGDGGETGRRNLARHTRLRMQEKIAADLKPHRDTHGNETVVMPWGVWQDLEMYAMHDVTTHATRHVNDGDRTYSEKLDRRRPVPVRHHELRPLEKIHEADFERAQRGREPRTWGGSVDRMIPREVRDQLRAVFHPGTPRPDSVHDPSDPTGDTAVHNIWMEEVSTAITTGRLPRRGDSTPKMLTYRGRELRDGMLANGVSLTDIAGMTIRSNES